MLPPKENPFDNSYSKASKMSAHLPIEIQAQIMKRLPVKILIQFKMVSKEWKALIESSEFMADYTISETGPNHLFLRYDKRSEELKYVSIVDNNTFPQHKFVHTLPESVKLLNRYGEPRVVGSSHGLFCLHGYSGAGKFNIVIWNPTINKSIVLDDCYDFSRIGFGVRLDTCDPMIVKINNEHDLPRRFEVFRLSTGVWTIPHSSNLPRESIFFTVNHVDVNGFIYWIVCDRVACLYFIVSFDMKSEKFTEVNVPKCLTSKFFSISKLRESLAVLDFYQEAEAQKQVCSVWMMMMIEDGVQKSFTKLYTISTQDASILMVPGFRNCGKPIVGTRTKVDDYDAGVLLSVYEPYSKNIDSLEIHRVHTSLTLFVSSYTETLLLLDQPEFNEAWMWFGIWCIRRSGEIPPPDAPCLFWLTLACVFPGLFFLHIRYRQILSSFSSLFIKRGASDADISMPPKYRFEVSNDENQADGRARRMVPILTNGPEFSAEGVYLVQDADCCICLCNYEDGAELYSLPCNHHFHTRCIRDWLVLRASCPLCKREMIR